MAHRLESHYCNPAYFLQLTINITLYPTSKQFQERWQDWPFSSAQECLATMGRAETERLWREYPVLDYGKGWDDANL